MPRALAINGSLRADPHDGALLRASRIVAASDAERRRLERNLHDGAQQRLVALSLRLRVLAEQLAPESEGARLLAEARDELAASLQELRELACGLHPAVLTDHGLGFALESVVSRSPVQVRLSVDLERRLPAPLEAAAYYLVSEALTNVAKHAGATCASVEVGREAHDLVVEVSDDGAGGADPASGSGLRGLADRADALGGTLSIASPAGRGTTIRARIPIPSVLPVDHTSPSKRRPR